MTHDVASFLKEHGPSRAGAIAEAWIKQGVAPATARQRMSRARGDVTRFPVSLLPKREAFLYLQGQRNHDIFWANLMRDLRATGSVYGTTIDAMRARGDFVSESDFRVICGGYAYPQRGQVTVDALTKTLVAADIIKPVHTDDRGDGFVLCPGLRHPMNERDERARYLAEGVVLDGLREWARKLGLAGFNSIAIRGDAHLKAIGPFFYDLAGPSYLLPLQRVTNKPGFLVADVFAEGTMTLDQIQYFIRKVRMARSAMREAAVLSILVAERFTGEALTAGHRAGIILATPRDLFGQRVGAAITSLVETLKNAAAYAAYSPDRLVRLVNDLTEIEGRSLNLRGVLFELLAAYLARRQFASIDVGQTARDPDTGKTADIDIQCFSNKMSDVLAIECKGKEPGGIVSLEEVETWLRKTATMRAHYAYDPRFRESKIKFELWTSGTFHPDALAKLEKEKALRIKAPIGWKDGQDALALAREDKEKSVADTLYQHFIHHPLSEVATVAATTGLVAPVTFDPFSLDEILNPSKSKAASPDKPVLALPAPSDAGDAS
jgi:hypothetical protein